MQIHHLIIAPKLSHSRRWTPLSESGWEDFPRNVPQGAKPSAEDAQRCGEMSQHDQPEQQRRERPRHNIEKQPVAGFRQWLKSLGDRLLDRHNPVAVGNLLKRKQHHDTWSLTVSRTPLKAVMPLSSIFSASAGTSRRRMRSGSGCTTIIRDRLNTYTKPEDPAVC